jgi:hypothetical protein
VLRVSGVVVSVVEISVTGWLIPDVLRHPVTRHYIPEERRPKYLYHFPNHLHEMLQPEQPAFRSVKTLSKCFRIFLCTVMGSVKHTASYLISKETFKELADATIFQRFPEMKVKSKTVCASCWIGG